MSRKAIKHITDFDEHDNFISGYDKHIIQKKKNQSELNDNFLENKPKHIVDFENDDNFRGKDL